MIADKLAGFDVVIVHVGTNNTDNSVSVCIDKYRQLAQGIIERNSMVHYRPWEYQYSLLNDNYKKVNAALMQYCHKCGFTFLGGLVNDWPSYLSKDGVHPSRFGNKVLADYLYQEACTLSIDLERCRIQQCYKETQAPSSWTGRTRRTASLPSQRLTFPHLVCIFSFLLKQQVDLPQHQLLSGKPALLPCRGTTPTSRPEPFKVLAFHLLAVSVSVARVARLGGPGTACLPPFSMAQVYQAGEKLRGGLMSQ
ncbi:uncharacterized protein LOC125947230 [Dermacentor silvarum]|nr:uncharacterized protein LOC125947230 [Dermacentor silvarum]